VRKIDSSGINKFTHPTKHKCFLYCNNSTALHSTWAAHGQRMGSAWAAHRQCMGSAWAVPGSGKQVPCA
jgi:hypothetical protein